MTCFVDDGENPDCVFDLDNKEGLAVYDCTVAEKLLTDGKKKLDCPYWKSKDPYLKRIER